MSEETPGDWTVAIHFGAPPNETAVRALIAMAAGVEAANAAVFEPVAAQDWVKASLEGLAPVQAGRFLVHGAHDRARLAANRIGIEIEAALAFGTGHHGTTRGCLLALDQILRSRHPRRILDLGTGSGVLAIAAAKALRRPVLASDIDSSAVRIARDNARLNRVGTLVKVVHAAGVGARRLRGHARFDLVLANILLGPLQRLAAPLAKLVAPGARVVLSGLLRSQGQAALAAYRAQGLVLERRIALDGWVTLVLRR
jgi:ribosomal protein L11 methyltransferase